jgi:hypothetical protein
MAWGTAMWKRGRTWLTIALLVWLNIVAWSIRTSPKRYTGVITLREYQVPAQGQAQATAEYTTLAPSYFFGPTWFSYAVALFIGFGLPFILPRLVPWLWHRGKATVRKLRGTPTGRKIVVWLVLLAICNFLAWEIVRLPYEDNAALSLYRQVDDGAVWYTYLLPTLKFHSPGFSYALAAFLGFGLPFLVPPLLIWLWRRLRRLFGAQPVSRETRPTFSPMQGKKGGVVVAVLTLFVAFNVLAWDWGASANKGEISLVLWQRENAEMTGRSYGVLYYGITPGIRVGSAGISWALSAFVGEILPFLLAPALVRRWRRPPPALPLPPVAGAPR